MIPMSITVDDYIESFPPGPDQILLQRIILSPEYVGRIIKPKSVVDGSVRFIGVGKILAVGEYPSEEPWVEERKKYLRSLKYAGFAFHVTADPVMMEQFVLPREISLTLIHVRDVCQDVKLDKLLERYQDWERKELSKIYTP